MEFDRVSASVSISAARRAERLLVPAAFVTALGNNVQLIAGALLMIRDDRTMVSVGLLFVAVAVPQAVLSPYFGRVADRHDRRRLWIGCDLTSAAVGAFTFGTARIASRSLVMTSVDEASVGRAFGLANAWGLAATVVVMLGVAELTDHTDSRWGFAAAAVVSLIAALAAGALLRRPPAAVGGTHPADGCHIPADADVRVVAA